MKLTFQQERGKRMALTNLAVFGGAFFTPILVGKITHTIGWPWSFYFVAIFTGVCLPLVIFFVPETAYRRSAHLNTDMASTEDVRLFQKPVEPGQELHSSNGTDAIEKSTATPEESAGKENLIPEKQPISTDHTGAGTPLKAYSETLRPFSGRKADERFWKLLFRPFPLFAHPAILWACLIQGAMIGWTVFIGIILAAIFIGPPIFWDEVNTGYAYTGPFVGAICGFLVAGGLADWSAKYMTKKNNGVYEPEFRIVLVIPQLVFGCSGLYLFGITSSRLVDYKWIYPVVGFGLQVGGMVIGAVAASLYIVDAHSKFNVTRYMTLLMPFQGRLLLKPSLAFSSSRSVP
jgi:MFS family permease